MNLQRIHGRIARREGRWAYLVWLLAPLSWAWSAGNRAARFLRDIHPSGATRIPAVVVSVGNIEMGGVGKTPVTMWLGERLSRMGIRTAIVARNLAVSRGRPVAVLPGSSGGGVPLSDEALMMGARLHPRCRVFAGPDKTETALRAFHETAPQVIVIDDGFQHLGLHRDLEVVVLNARHPFGIGGVFPLGTLREPPGVISRADFLWLNRASSGATEKLARRLSAQRNWKAPFIASTVVPQKPREPDGTDAAPCRVVAFAGIGRPESFRETLAEAGFEVAEFFEFPDHWNYTADDTGTLLEALRIARADRLVTTEKDAARLGRKGLRLLNPLVLPVTLSVDGAGEELLGRILDLVEERER
ncbi:MAG: tetraacyldisaccharide 4'-kinase [Candidatus Fermentibacteraceae bacterium]